MSWKSRLDTYVQVPHLIQREPRFTPVYNDPATLGTWLQMLLVADECYPNPAPLPRVAQTTIDTIIIAGLIDIVPGDRYLIPGLAEHREPAAGHARTAAWARWGKTAPDENKEKKSASVSLSVEDKDKDANKASIAHSIAPSIAPSIIERKRAWNDTHPNDPFPEETS